MDFRSKTDVRAEDDIRQEFMPVIISQYSASPRIIAILEGFRSEIEARSGILLFYEMMFNIDTAQGISLDIWGRIINISRTIYDEDNGYALTLSDEAYRTLLLYKALANISDATIPSLSRLNEILFESIAGSTKGWVIEILDEGKTDEGAFYNQRPMHIRWIFNRFFDREELAIFKVAGTFCRGGGVGWGLYAIDPESVFGFDGSELQPFNQGVFDPVGIVGG